MRCHGAQRMPVWDGANVRMRGTEDNPKTASPWVLVPCEQVGHWRDRSTESITFS